MRHIFTSRFVAASVAIWTMFVSSSNVSADSLTDAERQAIVAELQPLQERLNALRKSPQVSQDRWADAQIFVKGVIWALDFGPGR